jgi:AcrR family transcriptional regulator
MSGGMTLVGLSLLLYERVTVHSNFWTLLPSMILGGVGMALTMSPMTSAAMGAVPVDKAGVGSGVLNSFRQVGGSLGIAVMGAIVASYLHHPPRSPRGPGLRQRPPCGLRGRRGDHVRGGDRRRRHRADAARGRARAHRGAGGVSIAAPRMAAAERRQHLVETAIRLFTEGSYHGTTTAEIARAAGVSEPILYRHFASKRDLYLAALEHVWAKTRESWQRALDETPDACAAIEAIGKGHVSVRSPKLHLTELWVQALSEASEDPALRRHLRKHMREVHDFVADLVRRGQNEGAIAPDRDADSEAWIMLAGGILGMVGRRVGLLDDTELQAIRAARLSWLRG